MKAVEMEVQHIELMRLVSDLSEHRKMGRNIPRQVAIEPQGYVSARNQFCSGLAIGARKQDDLVTSPYQFVGQMRDDALGTSIELWRNEIRRKRGNWAMRIAFCLFDLPEGPSESSTERTTKNAASSLRKVSVANLSPLLER